jgi:hypothetical protein
VKRRTIGLAIAAISLTLVCGSAAIAANVGILHATRTYLVGRYVPFTPPTVAQRSTTTVGHTPPTRAAGTRPGDSTPNTALPSDPGSSGPNSTVPAHPAGADPRSPDVHDD